MKMFNLIGLLASSLMLAACGSTTTNETSTVEAATDSFEICKRSDILESVKPLILADFIHSLDERTKISANPILFPDGLSTMSDNTKLELAMVKPQILEIKTDSVLGRVDDNGVKKVHCTTVIKLDGSGSIAGTQVFELHDVGFEVVFTTPTKDYMSKGYVINVDNESTTKNVFFNAKPVKFVDNRVRQKDEETAEGSLFASGTYEGDEEDNSESIASDCVVDPDCPESPLYNKGLDDKVDNN